MRWGYLHCKCSNALMSIWTELNLQNSTSTEMLFLMTLQMITMGWCSGNSDYSLWTNVTNLSDNWDWTENEVSKGVSVLYIVGKWEIQEDCKNESLQMEHITFVIKEHIEYFMISVLLNNLTGHNHYANVCCGENHFWQQQYVFGWIATAPHYETVLFS